MSLFTLIIVQPIFNLLVLIYNLIPGHNFGLAIIVFTIIVRLLLWPLVKKQLHQAKKMRAVQPELKRIKKAANGDRQKESMMMMELYKERGINPLASIGVLILQIPILIGLYSGLKRVVDDPHQLITFSYPWIQHFGWMQELKHNIHLFDGTLVGVVDLTRSALGKEGTYWPAMIIVIASAVTQYYQSKQLMPTDKDAKSLRQILKAAGEGQKADQSEMNAAMSRNMRFFIPAMIFFFTVSLPSALSLYWLVGGLVAFIQQSIVLRADTEEMEAMADGSVGKGKSKLKVTRRTEGEKEVIEGEVVAKKSAPKSAAKTKPKSKKRRKK